VTANAYHLPALSGPPAPDGGGSLAPFSLPQDIAIAFSRATSRDRLTPSLCKSDANWQSGCNWTNSAGLHQVRLPRLRKSLSTMRRSRNRSSIRGVQDCGKCRQMNEFALQRIQGHSLPLVAPAIPFNEGAVIAGNESCLASSWHMESGTPFARRLAASPIAARVKSVFAPRPARPP